MPRHGLGDCIGEQSLVGAQGHNQSLQNCQNGSRMENKHFSKLLHFASMLARRVSPQKSMLMHNCAKLAEHKPDNGVKQDVDRWAMVAVEFNRAHNFGKWCRNLIHSC